MEWVKILGEGRKDLDLLVTAGYIHDIGWRDVVKGAEKLTWDELLKNEPVANNNSEPFAKELLTILGYSPEEIQKILQYIRAADAHESQADDEAIIVDSDNLSKLCLDHLIEKYQKQEWLKVFATWEKEFPTRMKTKKGKEIYPKLLDELKKEIGKK